MIQQKPASEPGWAGLCSEAQQATFPLIPLSPLVLRTPSQALRQVLFRSHFTSSLRRSHGGGVSLPLKQQWPCGRAGMSTQAWWPLNRVLETPGSLPPLQPWGSQQQARKRFCAKREKGVVGGGCCRRGDSSLPTQQDQTVLPTAIQINYVTEIGVPKNRLESLQRSSIFHNKMLHMARKRSARTFSLHSRGPPGRHYPGGCCFKEWVGTGTGNQM